MVTNAFALLAAIASLIMGTSSRGGTITRGPDTRHYALMVKTSFRHFPRRIAADAHNFTYLVHHSDLLFDKSLILNELLKARQQIIAVELSRKWGKSVTLHMIKRFLEIEIDHKGNRVPQHESLNYALFKDAVINDAPGQPQKFEEPFLVIRKYPNYLQSHCARFPIVFVEFKPVKVAPENQMYKAVADCISEAFKRHHYLIDILNGTAKNWMIVPKMEPEEGQAFLEQYRKYTECRANLTEITDGIFVLTKILHRVYNQTVFVLIDDYDLVLNDVQPDPQQVRNHLLKFLQRFYGTLLTRSFNNNTYLEKAIMMGTFRMERLLPTLDKFIIHKGTNTVVNRLAGFTDTEVHALFTYLDIPKKIENKAKDWYNGYKRSFADLTSLLSPNSIANFVNTRKFQNHRFPTDNFFLRNILKNDRMRSHIMEFIDGKFFDFHYKAVTFDDLIPFQEIIYRSHNYLKIYAKLNKQIYSYLLDAGYFRLHDNLQNYGYCVVLANEEIRNEVLTTMIDFYAPTYNISIALLENAIRPLAEFIYDDQTQSKNLTDILQPVFDGSKGEIARLVIHYLTSRITMTYDLRLRHVPHNDDDIKPCGILHFNDFGAIVYVARNATSNEDAMYKTKQFEEELKSIKNIKKVKFIAINVPSTGALDIRAEIRHFGPT